ncbi:NUDIX hydrolase [Nocardiopsis suaedae]|uniref:NUDIX domain-containing protein n=1 Tax=Nocardiopsis suaedae TaxID=3018444 RepID=A0ABT4TLK6_9ACTN|nr:NUDIX domain-containing protein [Nocardiopsis suaedae]MDA2805586.1 NUDIX domain-containing protein [Nocardiopsis suaedae]
MATPDFILRLRKHVGHEKLFLTGVTGVVIGDGAVGDEGAVLLHRRADDGAWSPPGGILEPGEQPAEALVREVEEETGIVAVPERVASVVTGDPFTYANGDVVQIVDVAFRCRPVGGRIRLDEDESLEVAWFPMDGLPPMADRVLDRVLRAHENGRAWFVPAKGSGQEGAT